MLTETSLAHFDEENRTAVRAGLQAQQERTDAVVGSLVRSAVARAAEAAEAKIEQRVQAQVRWITDELPLLLHRKTADALQQAWSTLPLPALVPADSASVSPFADPLLDTHSGGAATPASLPLPDEASSSPPDKPAAESPTGRPAPLHQPQQRPPWALTRAEAAMLEPKVAQPSRPTAAVALGGSEFQRAQLRLIRAAQRAAAAAEREPSGQLPASAHTHAELLQAALLVVTAAQAAASHSTGQAHPPPMPSPPPWLGGLASSLPMMPPGPSSLHMQQYPHPGFPGHQHPPHSYPPAHYTHPGHAGWAPPHAPPPLPPPPAHAHGCACAGALAHWPYAGCAVAMDVGSGEQGSGEQLHEQLQHDLPPAASCGAAPCDRVDGGSGSSHSGSSLASLLPSPSRKHAADASRHPSADRSQEPPACKPAQPVSVAASRPFLAPSGSKPKSFFGKKSAAVGAPSFGPFSKPSAAGAREAVPESVAASFTDQKREGVLGTFTHETTDEEPMSRIPPAHQTAKASSAVPEIRALPVLHRAPPPGGLLRDSEPSLGGVVASYADGGASASHGTASRLNGACAGDSTSRRHDSTLHDEKPMPDGPVEWDGAGVRSEEMPLSSLDSEHADLSSDEDAETGASGVVGRQPSPDELRMHRERALVCATTRSASHSAPQTDSDLPRASSVFGRTAGSNAISSEASPTARRADAEYQSMLLDALDLRDYDVLAELLDRLEGAGIHFSEMDLARELLASVDAVPGREASHVLAPPKPPSYMPPHHGERGRGPQDGSMGGGDELRVQNVEWQTEAHSEAQPAPLTPSHDPRAGLRIQPPDPFEASQGSVSTDSPDSPVMPTLVDRPVDSRRLGAGRLPHSRVCLGAPLANQAAPLPAGLDQRSAASHWRAGLQDASSPGGGSTASESPPPSLTLASAVCSGSLGASNQSLSREALPGFGHGGAGVAGGKLPASCLPAGPPGATGHSAGAPPPADVPGGEGGRTPPPDSPNSSAPSLIQAKVYGAPALSSELAAVQAQSSQATRGVIPLGGTRPLSSAAAQAPKGSIARTIMKLGARDSFGDSGSDLSEEELPEAQNNGDDSDGFD